MVLEIRKLQEGKLKSRPLVTSFLLLLSPHLLPYSVSRLASYSWGPPGVPTGFTNILLCCTPVPLWRFPVPLWHFHRPCLCCGHCHPLIPITSSLLEVVISHWPSSLCTGTRVPVHSLYYLGESFWENSLYFEETFVIGWVYGKAARKSRVTDAEFPIPTGKSGFVTGLSLLGADCLFPGAGFHFQEPSVPQASRLLIGPARSPASSHFQHQQHVLWTSVTVLCYTLLDTHQSKLKGIPRQCRG